MVVSSPCRRQHDPLQRTDRQERDARVRLLHRHLPGEQCHRRRTAPTSTALPNRRQLRIPATQAEAESLRSISVTRAESEIVSESRVASLQSRRTRRRGSRRACSPPAHYLLGVSRAKRLMPLVAGRMPWRSWVDPNKSRRRPALARKRSCLVAPITCLLGTTSRSETLARRVFPHSHERAYTDRQSVRSEITRAGASSPCLSSTTTRAARLEQGLNPPRGFGQ